MASDSIQLLMNMVFPAVRLMSAAFVTSLIKSPTTGPHLTAIPENLSLRRRRHRNRSDRSAGRTEVSKSRELYVGVHLQGEDSCLILQFLLTWNYELRFSRSPLY